MDLHGEPLLKEEPARGREPVGVGGQVALAAENNGKSGCGDKVDGI